METIARSKNLYGPYEPNSANPILTNANTTEYCKTTLDHCTSVNLKLCTVQTIYHADLFQDAHGKWWSVALSTRGGPAFKIYPMGRETILTNATCEDGTWPVIHNPVRGVMNGRPLPKKDQSLPEGGSVSLLPLFGTALVITKSTRRPG
jgi:beta-xylosidase